MEWMHRIHDDPLSWLLEPEDFGVRYLTLRDLLDLDDTNADLSYAKKEAYRTGPIKVILDAVDPEGFWERPGSGYNPKYRSAVWSLILLAQLGATSQQDGRINLACRYMLENGLTEGGQFSVTGSPSGTIDCLQGNMCAAMLDLGVEDPRLDMAFDWMARSVTGEGIAPSTDRNAKIRYYAGNCGPLFACGANMGQTCAWGAVKVMLAFSKLPRKRWTPEIENAVKMGIDFLFSVDPAQANYPSPTTGKPSGNWWKFGFPVFYITDLLQLVEVLARLGYGKDPRLQESIRIILQKQDKYGRWSMEYPYTGKTWFDFGPHKVPNKWVTLRALQVLKLADKV